MVAVESYSTVVVQQNNRCQMSEYLQWFCAVSIFVLCAGWLVFVAWMRFDFTRRMVAERAMQRTEREHVRRELGATAPDSTHEIPDWLEAENEMIDSEIKRIRRQTRPVGWGQ